MDDVSWDLIAKMCDPDPRDRVNITYVVNRLKQFTLDRHQTKGHVCNLSTPSTAKTVSLSLDEHLFEQLGGATIPSTLKSIQSKCQRLPDAQWTSESVCPAFVFIFDLLQEREKAPSDVEFVKFCAVLALFQRYLRTAVSQQSLFRFARSRKVAESHHVIYSELDHLLDLLNVSETDAIRVWRRRREASPRVSVVESRQARSLNDDTTSLSYLKKSNKSSSAVSLKLFDPQSPHHERWSRAGLAASTTLPSWYFSLKDLVFSESDEIGQGSFGTVYTGSWLDTLVVVKFMGYEEDFDTVSTDLLLHEVRMWHRLNHPHVLKLYGACHVGKQFFVCSAPENRHVVWQKMYQVALGLEYLHALNIAHNDLKCDNILVSADGEAKLIDFGLSGLLNKAEIQVDAKKMGAVHWKSPEYLSGGRPSFASDVYSLAMCIIEAVSGEYPWGKYVLPSVVRYQVKKGKSPKVLDVMNAKQRDLIHWMVQFDPLERVKMAFVIDKLNEIAQDERAPSVAP